MLRLILSSSMVWSALAAGDQSATTGSVSAQFMGASGGMKLFTDESKGFVMIQQSKIEEVSADGSKCGGKCTSINMAGGTSEWSEVIEQKDGDATTVYSTTFTKVSGDVTFSMTAHLARTTSDVVEARPCSGCAASTAGECINSDKVCEEANQNSQEGSQEAQDACATDYTLCSEKATVVKDELKFSFVVKGFTFQDPTNKFTYGITIKDKTGKTPTTSDDTSGKRVEMEGGHVELPTKGKVTGGAEDKVVDATIITTETTGGSFTVNFEFASWEDGESLYYDPTVAIASDENGAAFASPSLLALVVCAVAAMCL